MNEMSKRVFRDLGRSLVYFGLLYASVFGFSKHVEHNQKTRSLLEKVAEKADKNKDDFTDNKEWNKVYTFLGKEYNLHQSKPIHNLSISEMEKYLKQNS